MNFSLLENLHTSWRDILVIGRDMERDGQKCHMVGMTLADQARLYIIEPYSQPEHTVKKGPCTQRRLLREQEENDCSYLHCSSFFFGNERFETQGGTGGPLQFAREDYGTIQLFLDMMSAGWVVPDWLKAADWDSLQLVTLDIADRDRLPEFSSEMPITITHAPHPTRHILEKRITLQVGKSRSFDFVDSYGDLVQCHINAVTLMDVWKNTEEKFRDPRLTERLSPEQLAEARRISFDALEQSCPKGMCYIGVEYECSKDLSLSFYSRQFLSSLPETHQGSSSFLLMRIKPDKKTGTHGLPLRGCVISTPVPPDTSKIPAELFLYFEKTEEWTERI